MSFCSILSAQSRTANLRWQNAKLSLNPLSNGNWKSWSFFVSFLVGFLEKNLGSSLWLS